MNRFTQGVGLVAKVVLVGSSVALLGAACWKGVGDVSVNENTNTVAGNGNAVANENVNTVEVNANTINTNTNEDTNVGVNANVGANTNTNTDSTGEVDTSDWLTYTNEEYGFSFRYPEDWAVTVNDANVVTVLEPTAVLKGKGNIESSESFSTMSEEEILLTEPGKETMPLVDEKFLTVNQLPAYRSLRQLKKGDLLRPSAPESTERAESTLTEIEYRYLNNTTLFRLTFTIQGDTYEKFFEIVDAVGQSFSI